VLVVVGLLAIVRWGGRAVQPPLSPADDDTVPDDRPPVGLFVRRYLWYLTVAIGAGFLAAGAGGRLSRAVPLLALTPRAVVAHVPLLLLALGSAALVAAIVGVVVVVLASQIPGVAGAWRDRRSVTAGRVSWSWSSRWPCPASPRPSSTSWGGLTSM
jgi:hypothetical protein